MKEKITVSAPGKIQILGEHSAVHGKPVIVSAVSNRCFIKITSRADGEVKVSSVNFKEEITTDFKDINARFKKAKKDWEAYEKNNDIPLLKSITKLPLDYPLIIIGEFLNYFRIESLHGFDLKINSEIPIGAGMGSSSALAVSILGGLFLLTGKPFEKDIINKVAFMAEQKRHGRPSGGDNTTSCFGGLIWFKRGEDVKQLGSSLSKNLSQNFYTINTGTPTETTGEMIGIVRGLMEKRPEYVRKIFDEQEKLVNELVTALKDGKDGKVISIIRKGESNLEKLGVVSEYSKKIIRNVEASGGAAKICGGGGKTKATGIILIYINNEAKLKTIAKKSKLSYSRVILGTEGVRIE